MRRHRARFPLALDRPPRHPGWRRGQGLHKLGGASTGCSDPRQALTLLPADPIERMTAGSLPHYGPLWQRADERSGRHHRHKRWPNKAARRQTKLHRGYWVSSRDRGGLNDQDFGDSRRQMCDLAPHPISTPTSGQPTFRTAAADGSLAQFTIQHPQRTSQAASVEHLQAKSSIAAPHGWMIEGVPYVENPFCCGSFDTPIDSAVASGVMTLPLRCPPHLRDGVGRVLAGNLRFVQTTLAFALKRGAGLKALRMGMPGLVPANRREEGTSHLVTRVTYWIWCR